MRTVPMVMFVAHSEQSRQSALNNFTVHTVAGADSQCQMKMNTLMWMLLTTAYSLC
jgi:hypothetical protein